jgi:hypothetical protein
MTPPWPKPGRKGKRKTIGQQSRAAIDEIREQVYVRDDYHCIAAGFVGQDNVDECAGRLTPQHRVGRGFGGSALFDRPGYLLTMCIWHNTLAERDADFADLCTTNGWSIPRHSPGATDPTKVPVLYSDGWYVLALDHCSRYGVSFERALVMRQELG